MHVLYYISLSTLLKAGKIYPTIKNLFNKGVNEVVVQPKALINFLNRK